MKKWLFKSQDIIAFLLGIFCGFGINLISGKLTELHLFWGILSALMGTLTFVVYRFWVWNTDEFDFYIRHGKWERKEFDWIETWICEDTDQYQLVIWNNCVEGFKENWTDIFADKESNTIRQLFLKRNGIIIREFRWVKCDGYRIWMPIPNIRNLWGWKREEMKMEYFFVKNSLEYRMLLKIWDPGIGTFEDIFQAWNIKII